MNPLEQHSFWEGEGRGSGLALSGCRAGGREGRRGLCCFNRFPPSPGCQEMGEGRKQGGAVTGDGGGWGGRGGGAYFLDCIC